MNRQMRESTCLSMEEIDLVELMMRGDCRYGEGYGFGDGDGDGTCVGDGYGDGYCDGEGYGNCYCDGDGFGNCDGEGFGEGDSDGDCDYKGEGYGNGDFKYPHFVSHATPILAYWVLGDNNHKHFGKPCDTTPGSVHVWDAMPDLCNDGLHASLTLEDARKYRIGMAYRVACSGLVIFGDDKLVCTRRVVLEKV